MIQAKSSAARFLYLDVYEFYKESILSRRLSPGTKLPSIRKCSETHRVSRTTVQTAYLALSADGYIAAKAQSGYYVTGIAMRKEKKKTSKVSSPVLYDFTSQGADRDGFRFDLWGRYLRGAFRSSERLLTYGDAQGEEDLRQALSDYLRSSRNILCTPEEIVIGASTQSLLQILCPLLKKESKTISLPTRDFIQARTVFEDFGFTIHFRDKDSGVIYVSPALMTKWGDVMTVRRRIELLDYTRNRGSWVIEDDYGNEFVYSPSPTPSLYGLDTNARTIYLGSFSRLLLPSVRVSFMCLPPVLLNAYLQKAESYNQTASKAEQIALAGYLQDGHLASQIRRQKRLYAHKAARLSGILTDLLGSKMGKGDETYRLLPLKSGTTMALALPAAADTGKIVKEAEAIGLKIRSTELTEKRKAILLSFSFLTIDELVPAAEMLVRILP